MQHIEARSGAYADSVTLMQVTAKAQAVAGVQAALVAMGTELNLELLAGLGLAAPTRRARTTCSSRSRPTTASRSPARSRSSTARSWDNRPRLRPALRNNRRGRL